MASPSVSSYRLDQFGWLSFQRLATSVLETETGLSDLHWQGVADVGRIAVVEEDVRWRDAGAYCTVR